MCLCPLMGNRECKQKKITQKPLFDRSKMYVHFPYIVYICMWLLYRLNKCGWRGVRSFLWLLASNSCPHNDTAININYSSSSHGSCHLDLKYVIKVIRQLLNIYILKSRKKKWIGKPLNIHMLMTHREHSDEDHVLPLF